MAKVVKSYKTAKASVDVMSDGSKRYKGYNKNNNAGKPTDRKITIIKKPGKPDTSEHTAKTSYNDARRSAGKKPVGKQAPGRGTQIAHKSGSRSSTSAKNLTAQSAKKNIGNGNRSRGKR